MKRCATLALALAASLFPPWVDPAQAQAAATSEWKRRFPATALRGWLRITQSPDILLNGQPARLAPGARIRDDDNMLALPGSLTDRTLLVHYTVDLYGQLLDVWVLTESEARRRPWPATPQQAQAWSFDAAAQTWSQP